MAQENIHYLSEYYLWEELLTSPDKAVGRLALHMQGNTGTDANGQPIGITVTGSGNNNNAFIPHIFHIFY